MVAPFEPVVVVARPGHGGRVARFRRTAICAASVLAAVVCLTGLFSGSQPRGIAAEQALRNAPATYSKYFNQAQFIVGNSLPSLDDHPQDNVDSHAEQVPSRPGFMIATSLETGYRSSIHDVSRFL